MSHLKTCLGVDLGQHTVKIVEITLDKGVARVVRAAQGTTGVAPGMSPEERRATIATAVKDLLKKNKFGTRKAVFSVSGLQAFFRRFRLPSTNQERLERMIQFEARQQIPFPVDKTALQYQYREIPGEGDVEVLLSAIRTDDIRDFMQIVVKCGLTPVAVGVSSFALFNAHRFTSLKAADAQEIWPHLSPARRKAGKKGKQADAPKEADKGKKAQPAAADADAQTLVLNKADLEADAPGDDFPMEEIKGLINIGATSYDLAVGPMGKENAGLLFVRTVARGGDNMTRAIQKALGVESYFDAERIKTSATQLMAFNFDFENEGDINQEASMAVTEVTDGIIVEIRRSLDFFITQPDGMAIDSVALSGGQAQLPRIDSYLEEKLTVPVAVASGFPAESAIQWNESLGVTTPYIVATGLALQGVGLGTVNVDFLPEEHKIVRDFPYKITAVMAILLVAIIGFAWGAGETFADKYKTNRDSLQNEIQKKAADVANFDRAQASHDEIATSYISLSKTFGQRDYWMKFLARLAEMKPPQVLLEDVTLDHDGSVKIIGLSEVPVAAADLQDALKEALGDEFSQEPKIESVQPVGRAVDGLGSDPSRFTLTLKLKTKRNHLKITPTPTPTPAGGPGAVGVPGRPAGGGAPAQPGGGGGRVRF